MLVRSVKKDSDGNKEFVFCRGLTAYKKGLKAVVQDIDCALNEWVNDCYWALDSGIDWLTRLGYHNQKDLLDEDIVSTISNRYGVISVQDFESSVLSRAYTCTCQVLCIYSEDYFTFNFSKEV